MIPEMNSMMQVLNQNKLKAMHKRLVNLLSATADERYLDFIKTYPNLAFRFPQHMIASYLGITPES